MNDLELENLLQSLTPAGPSASLQQRVEHELELDNQWLRNAAPAAAPRRRRLPHWLPAAGWGALGAAAALLVMGIIPEQPPSPTAAAVAALTPQSPIMPMTTIREVVDAQDQGIQYNTFSHLPEQHVKLVSVERHAWIDPRDGAEITVEVPREESVILPVSFQ